MTRDRRMSLPRVPGMEPQTEAGRELVEIAPQLWRQPSNRSMPMEPMQLEIRKAVLAIESEARRLTVERLAHENDWLWDGHAGHLIIGNYCRFHLNTRVGNYRISTVGEYVPSHGRTDGESLGGEEYGLFKSVGAGRLFETFVFEVDGPGMGEPKDYLEIDSLSANDHDTANRNHMELCRKYAALAREETRE